MDQLSVKYSNSLKIRKLSLNKYHGYSRTAHLHVWSRCLQTCKHFIDRAQVLFMNSWKRFFYSLFEIPKGPFISDSGGLLFSRLELVLAPVKKMQYIGYNLLMTLCWHSSGEYSSIALSGNSCSIALGRVWCCCWSSHDFCSLTWMMMVCYYLPINIVRAMRWGSWKP